jgi:hypothetical protein
VDGTAQPGACADSLAFALQNHKHQVQKLFIVITNSSGHCAVVAKTIIILFSKTKKTKVYGL